MSESSDTRIYRNPHYHSNYDYDGFRTFDVTLPESFVIQSTFEYTGHDVEQSKSRRFELWSPNSDCIPVYPGTPSASFSMVPPLSHPRTDGSGGRFDWTLVPQHLNSSKLHHPFIEKPQYGRGLAEFEYLTSVWRSSPGGLCDAFIARLLDRARELEGSRVSSLSTFPGVCPDLTGLVDSRPTADEINQFRGLRSWEACVSGVTHIQRLLREKAAWLLMVKDLSACQWSFAVPLTESIPKSRFDLMGSWVNGGKSEHITWLLHSRVPCYFIHQYRDGIDFGHQVSERRSRRVFSSFCPPDTWHLRLDVNAYENIAIRNGVRWADENNLPPRGVSVRGNFTQLSRSASHEHGYVRPVLDRYIPPEPEQGSIDWPSEIVDASRVPWFRPPPVRRAWDGRWLRFAEEELESADDDASVSITVMRDRGFKFKGDSEGLFGPYFDREHGRQLWFLEEPSIPDGVVDADIYGQPVPYYRFAAMATQGSHARTRFIERSRWMYLQEIPKRSEVMFHSRTIEDYNNIAKLQVSAEAPTPLPGMLPCHSNTKPTFTADLEVDMDNEGALDDLPPTPPSSPHMQSSETLSPLATAVSPAPSVTLIAKASPTAAPAVSPQVSSLHLTTQSLPFNALTPRSPFAALEDFPTPLKQLPLQAPSEPGCGRTSGQDVVMQEDAQAAFLISASPLTSVASLSPMPEDYDIEVEHQESSVPHTMSQPTSDDSNDTPDANGTSLSTETGAQSRQEPTPTPSRCVMLSGLAPGTSLTCIARLLRRPLIPGDRLPYGCGVQISGSAPGLPRDGTSLIIECCNARASSIVEAAWDNSEMDGRMISAKQMSVCDLEGILISPYHEFYHDEPFDPSSLPLCPGFNDVSNIGGGRRVLAVSRDKSSTSYQPYYSSGRTPRGRSTS
jgi:hypothetical protein